SGRAAARALGHARRARRRPQRARLPGYRRGAAPVKRRIDELQARRARLVARAQAERSQIAGSLQPVAGIARIVDLGWDAVRWLRERPLIVAAALAFALAAGPRRGVSLIRLALGAWQAWRWVGRA